MDDSEDVDYMTVPEVADRFRVSKMTVHRWIAAGILPALQLGRVTRIPAEAVDALDVRDVRAG